MVEQRTFNPFVAGSIPALPTSYSKGLEEILSLFVCSYPIGKYPSAMEP